MGPAAIDYARACFVIMPFGRKRVGEAEVDFDFIYHEIFEPAIRATLLGDDGEQGHLEPRRTDQDFFSGTIDQEMFAYLEYSRFALADISGLNANVWYELGHRHRANPAGTAVFRQSGTVIPFDIKSVKAFDYQYEPVAEVAKSRQLVTRVLTESLRYNRPDSPIQLALARQQVLAQQQAGATGGRAGLDEILTAAENDLRDEDVAGAIGKLREAVKLAPDQLMCRMRLGLVLKDAGRMPEALAEFVAAGAIRPDYAEALRERGIVENRLYWREHRPAGRPTGEESLREAIRLSPEDYDALASLGGLLKREALRLDGPAGEEESLAVYEAALGCYRRATELSNGHPYPLLNELKIQARIAGALTLDARTRVYLKRAERIRQPEAEMKPPHDAPWCLFDLAEIALYRGDRAGFLSYLEEGLTYCIGNPDLPRTFRDGLRILKRGRVELPGLDEGLAILEEAGEPDRR